MTLGKYYTNIQNDFNIQKFLRSFGIMSKNILIDTTNNIETRIAVTDDAKLDDFEIEPSKKNAVKGDIYLA